MVKVGTKQKLHLKIKKKATLTIYRPKPVPDSQLVVLLRGGEELLQ